MGKSSSNGTEASIAIDPVLKNVFSIPILLTTKLITTMVIAVLAIKINIRPKNSG